jgi:hypothetical protein
MGKREINRVSGKILIVLSFVALLAVLSGYTQPAQPDEGTAAHIFSAGNRGAGTDNLTLPSHSELEPAFAERAIINSSSHCSSSSVRESLLS